MIFKCGGSLGRQSCGHGELVQIKIERMQFPNFEWQLLMGIWKASQGKEGEEGRVCIREIGCSENSSQFQGQIDLGSDHGIVTH